MRRQVTLPLFILVTSSALFAQAPSPNQPLQVKEGEWDLTTTSTLAPAAPDADTLSQIPPQQREAMLAALKAAQAHPQTQERMFCLTHDQLLSGDILGISADCPTQHLVSNSQKVETTVQCESQQST